LAARPGVGSSAIAASAIAATTTATAGASRGLGLGGVIAAGRRRRGRTTRRARASGGAIAAVPAALVVVIDVPVVAIGALCAWCAWCARFDIKGLRASAGNLPKEGEAKCEDEDEAPAGERRLSSGLCRVHYFSPRWHWIRLLQNKLFIPLGNHAQNTRQFLHRAGFVRFLVFV
jgi:hypothetical protein